MAICGFHSTQLVDLLLHPKFRLNSQSGLQGDIENRFSNRHNLANFDLEVILLLQCVSTQIAQRCVRSQKLVFKMLAMAAFLDCQSA